MCYTWAMPTNPGHSHFYSLFNLALRDAGMSWSIFVVLCFLKTSLIPRTRTQGTLLLVLSVGLHALEKWDIPTAPSSLPAALRSTESSSTNTYSKISHGKQAPFRSRFWFCGQLPWSQKYKVFTWVRHFLMAWLLWDAAYKGHQGVRCFPCTVLS